MLFRSMGINEMNCDFIKYNNCEIRRGDRPAGASFDRRLATNRGGIICAYSKRGPQIRSCIFRQTGDDAIAVFGRLSQLYAINPFDSRKVQIISRRAIAKDDELRFFINGGNSSSFLTAAASESMYIGQTPDGVAIFELVLKNALPQNASHNDYLCNITWCGAGFVIDGNEISNSHSRGIVIKSECSPSSAGQIGNNTIERIKSCGILLYNAPNQTMEGATLPQCQHR